MIIGIRPIILEWWWGFNDIYIIIYICIYIYTCTVFVKNATNNSKIVHHPVVYHSVPYRKIAILEATRFSSQEMDWGPVSDQHGLCGSRVKSLFRWRKMVIFFFARFCYFFLGCSFRIDVSMFHSYSIWWFLNDCNSWDGLKHVEITNRRSILWLRSVKFSVEPVGYHPVGPIGCAQATSPEFWS